MCGLVGCSSSRGHRRVSPQVYGSQELGDFLRDTAQVPTANNYLIGVGDRLDVVFFFHKELTTPNLLVRSDGRITLPYVGDVMAAGLAPTRLDSVLTERFSEILKDPNLSVIVRESQAPRVYVLGAVKSPGSYKFETELSLLQAVARAGGPIPGAKTGEVLVVRRAGISKIVGVRVDLKAIMEGKSIQNDFAMKNYDIIMVPRTGLKKAADAMDLLNDIIRPGSDLILRAWQIRVLQELLAD